MDKIILLSGIWIIFGILTGFYLYFRIYLGTKINNSEYLEILLSSIFWPIILCFLVFIIIIIMMVRFIDWCFLKLFSNG